MQTGHALRVFFNPIYLRQRLCANAFNPQVFAPASAKLIDVFAKCLRALRASIGGIKNRRLRARKARPQYCKKSALRAKTPFALQNASFALDADLRCKWQIRQINLPLSCPYILSKRKIILCELFHRKDNLKYLLQ